MNEGEVLKRLNQVSISKREVEIVSLKIPGRMAWYNIMALIHCVQRLSDANFGERKLINSRKRTLLESMVSNQSSKTM